MDGALYRTELGNWLTDMALGYGLVIGYASGYTVMDWTLDGFHCTGKALREFLFGQDLDKAISFDVR